jgi:hypothetical protein
MKYSSRFIDQPCLARFDRGDMAPRLHATLLGELNDRDGAVDLLDQYEVALV